MIHAEMKELVANSFDGGLVLYIVHPDVKQDWFSGHVTDVNWRAIGPEGQVSIRGLTQTLRLVAVENRKIAEIKTVHHEPDIYLDREVDVVVLIGFEKPHFPAAGENVIIQKWRMHETPPRTVFPL